MSCGKHFQQQLLNRLDAIEDAVDLLSTPIQMASRTFDYDDGAITLGSMTGGAAVKSLVFHLDAGQRIELFDPTAMTTAVFDNTDSAGRVTLVFSPPSPMPPAWTLTAATTSESLVSAFF